MERIHAEKETQPLGPVTIKFNLLDRVRITDGSHAGEIGFIIAERVEEGVRLYNVVAGSDDHWVPEPWLEVAPIK